MFLPGLRTEWSRDKGAQSFDAGATLYPEPQESVDHVRRIYLASDVALGAGLAAFGTGVIWLIAGSGPSKEKSPYAFDVKPSSAGALATVSGSF